MTVCLYVWGNKGVVLQGESEDELPEEVLCAIQLQRPDINLRVPLDA